VVNVVQKVIAGNQGAAKVIADLQWYQEWFEYVRWLARNGYTGQQLWVLYSAHFNHVREDFKNWVEEQMEAEKEGKKHVQETLKKNKEEDEEEDDDSEFTDHPMFNDYDLWHWPHE